MVTRLADEDQQIGENQIETRYDSQKRRHEEKMVFRNRLEYLAILFILQSGNNNFILTATKSVQYKGISFLILYYSLHHIVIAPLQCQHLFLGYYSKFGYLKIWNIFPIGYGIGASMMAYSLYTCIHWSSLTGQLVLQLALVPFMPDNYWTDCTYESAKLPPCYGISSKDKNIDCNKTYYPGIAQYYRVSNLWRPDEKPDSMGPINTRWIAASAFVWIIVGILTIRDFKSFKGVFAKLCYFITTLSALIVILQWASSSQSEQAALLMLDFTGLFSYEIWVEALTHAIMMSHIYEGTIIQLGSYGPENTMPDTDALLVGFLTSVLQYFEIFNVFSSYGRMAELYSLNIRCFIWPHQAIVMALKPTRLSSLPMSKLWISIDFLILMMRGIMEMTIVFTSTVNSFLEAFPSVKSYRSYLVSVSTISCFSISIIFMTKVGEIFSNHYIELAGTWAALLILAIMSSLILFSYSVTRLCDDIQFIHKFEPTLIMKAVFYLTPLFATYYAVSHMANLFSLSDRINSLYNDLWQLRTFLIVSSVGLVLPLFFVGFFMYGIHVRTHTVGLLFHPTHNWGSPNEELNIARKRFNPRRELRYKANKSCTHICMLGDTRMEIEIQKREAVRNILRRYGFEAMNGEI